MSNYSQVVFFGPKDALAHLDANKAIKGVQVDAELALISTAISSKFDTTSLGAASGAAQLDGSSRLQATNFPALTGDITTSAGSLATTLSSTGVSASTYTKLTVDVKGRVTAGTTLVAGDIPSLPTSIITSGTWADARVAQSNVTQHQAALALAASQITSGVIATARHGSGAADSTVFLRGDQTWAAVPGGNVGTVTSVAVSGSTGLTTGGGPITSSGTLTFTLGTELQGLSALSANGVVQRTGAGTYTSAALVSTDIPSLDTAKITTGSFADGRIQASNVTQWQGNITIAASQIGSGTVATARLGSNTANSTKYLRGDQAWTAVAASEVTGLATSATTDTTNANNITAGLLAIANGGTGASTATNARSGLGAAASATTISVSGTGLSGGGDLSANRTITIDQTAMATRNITGKAGITKTLSTSAASGGSDGDIWYKY